MTNALQAVEREAPNLVQMVQHGRIEFTEVVIEEADFQSVAKAGAGLLEQAEIRGSADDHVDDLGPAGGEMPDLNAVRERPVNLQHLDTRPSLLRDERARVRQDLVKHERSSWLRLTLRHRSALTDRIGPRYRPIFTLRLSLTTERSHV